MIDDELDNNQLEYLKTQLEKYKNIIDNYDDNIIIKGCDSEYKINREILKCKSEYFNALFLNRTKDSKKTEIFVELDRNSLDIFIDYINDDLIINENNIIDVIPIAYYYGFTYIIQNLLDIFGEVLYETYDKMEIETCNAINNDPVLQENFVNYFKEYYLDHILTSRSLYCIWNLKQNNYKIQYANIMYLEFDVIKILIKILCDNKKNNLAIKLLFQYFGLKYKSNYDDEMLYKNFNNIKDMINWSGIKNKLILSIIINSSLYTKNKIFFDNIFAKMFLNKLQVV